MNDEKKTGILFILAGIFISVAALPFLSGYSRDKDVLTNLYQAGIELRKEKKDDAVVKTAVSEKVHKKTINFSKLIPKRIPFRLFLVITVIFFYLGIVRIDASIRKAGESKREGPE